MSLTAQEIEALYRRQGEIALRQGDLRTELRAALERLADEAAHAAEAIRLGHNHNTLRLEALGRVAQLRGDLGTLDRESNEIGVKLRLGGEIPVPPVNGVHRRAEDA